MQLAERGALRAKAGLRCPLLTSFWRFVLPARDTDSPWFLANPLTAKIEADSIDSCDDGGRHLRQEELS